MMKTLLVMLLLAFGAEAAGKGNNLHGNYYRRTCPQAEEIVANVVAEAVQGDRTLAPALLRLHFHDCFVGGCDASILLDQNPQNEMESPGNKMSIRGLEVIDEAKARLEAECPGIVSCADIIAFAARDSAVNAGSLPYKVPGGRLDARISNAAATVDLPAPTLSVAQMTEIFAKKGLTQDDMVTLLGAHSIGTAHCSIIQDRINYINPAQDKSLDHAYALELIEMCPRIETWDIFVSGANIPLDPITPYILDNAYYTALMSNKGLLRSDQRLMYDPQTRKMVEYMASNTNAWRKKFGKSMVRMGRTGVITRRPEGEIRKQCRAIN